MFDQLDVPVRYRGKHYDPKLVARCSTRLDGLSVIAINTWCRQTFGSENFVYVPPHTHAMNMNRPYRVRSIWVFMSSNDHMRFILHWQGSGIVRIKGYFLKGGIALHTLTDR